MFFMQDNKTVTSEDKYLHVYEQPSPNTVLQAFLHQYKW